MRRIIVNGRFLTRRITGVERYARELLCELDLLVHPGEIEIAVPPGTRDLPEYKNIEIKTVGKRQGLMWENVSFPYYTHKEKAVSLNLCNTAPLAAPGIVCIHDMKTRARPQDFSKKFLYWYRLLFRNETKRAIRIITVSKFSKDEICKYYHVNPDRITVIPNAWQHFERISYDENALNQYGLEKKGFFFSMSSMEPNKNFKWIAETAQKDRNLVYAVAGSINNRVFSGSLGFECPENMKLLGYVSDEEAKTLMRDCKAFLFPTFYEGFGIPPLEALSAGCEDVIVSDTAVMREIFGECVSYIDPSVPIPGMIKTNKVSKGSREAVLRKYSWNKSAKQLLELLQTV